MAFIDAKEYANIAKILQFCKNVASWLPTHIGLFFAALLSKK